ncbi:MAG: tetratricopeptide repeat protein [Deltaproteobacteria bacterium]|nr:tetratricopeptide repeat protein [Deltaproteobacteria bacterium]
MSRAACVAGLALLALTALAYGAGLSNQFVWDDRDHIVANPRLQSACGLLELVSREQGRYYRPLIFVSYAAERRLWGLSPNRFHLTNLLLHLANVALLIAVARRSGGSDIAALTGAALFALHPIQSEAVAYISGRTDLLVVFGALLSCLVWLGDGPPRRRGVLAALAGGVAMLGKESGFAIVPLWLWLAWRSAASRAPLLAPGLLLATLLLAWRAAVSGALAPADGLALPSLTTLSGAGWAIVEYLHLLIWPATLQVDRLLPLPSGGAANAVGLVVLASAIALAGHGARRRDAIGMWTAWTASFYLPAANLIAIYPALAGRALFMPEHNLYAPLAGLGLLVGLALARATARSTALRWAALAAILPILLGLAARTSLRVQDWRSERELFGAAVTAGAGSPRVWFNYGVALLEQGAFAAAADAFAGAIARAPNDGWAWANMALARQRAGDLDGAAAAYARAVELQPDDAQLFENLGTLALRRGDAAAARAAFTRALALDPGLSRSRRALEALDAVGRP